jgi:serine/threonine protein kinase
MRASLYSNGIGELQDLTFEYVAPELLRVHNSVSLAAPSSDVWSLAVVMLELLLGTPFVFAVSNRRAAIIQQRVSDERERQRELFFAALQELRRARERQRVCASAARARPAADGSRHRRSAPVAKNACARSRGAHHSARDCRARLDARLSWEANKQSMSQLVIVIFEIVVVVDNDSNNENCRLNCH